MPASGTEKTHRMRDLPPAFWWLWTSELVVWIGRFVVPFMTIFLTSEIGLNPSQAGIIVAAYGVGVFASSLIGGILADKIGRKKTLIGSLLFSAAFLVVIPLANDPIVIALCLVTYGLFNGAGQPVIITMIGDLVPQEQRRTAFNYSYWAVNMGYAIGPLLAGFIATSSFSLLFYAQAILLSISVIIVGSRVPATFAVKHVSEVKTDGVRGRSGIMTVLHDRVFLIFTGIMFLNSVVYVQSTTTLPLVMGEQGFESYHYGYLLTLNGLLLCVLQIPAMRILGRWSREVVMATAVLATALGVGLQAAAASMTFFIVAVSIWTLGELGSHAQAQSISSDLAPKSMRGSYQGVYATHHNVATIFGPILGGLILTIAGSTALWLSAAGLSVCVSIAMVLTRKQRLNRVAEVRVSENPSLPAGATLEPGLA